jgi:hypothetical protein
MTYGEYMQGCVKGEKDIIVKSELKVTLKRHKGKIRH